MTCGHFRPYCTDPSPVSVLAESVARRHRLSGHRCMSAQPAKDEAANASSPLGAPQHGGRRWPAVALKLALGLGLLAWLVLGGKLRLSAFAGIVLGWEIAAAAGFILAALLLPCVRWWLLLRYQGIDIAFTSAVKLTWVGYFFGLFLPGAASGDLARGYYIVRDSPRSRARAASTVVIDRGLGLYSLFFIGLAPAAILYARGAATPAVRAMTVTTLLLAIGLTLAGALLWHPKSRRRVLRLLPAQMRAPLGSCLEDYCVRPGGIVACFAISLAANMLNVLAFIPAAAALREQLPLLSALLAGPLIILANSLPISPGGLGVAESTSSALLHSFGFVHGAEVMLLLRVLIVLSALPGAVTYIIYHGRR